MALSSTSKAFVRVEQSAVECSVPIIADDSASALSIARVLLNGHVPPKVVVPDEPAEEEAPAPARQGKAKAAGKGRVSRFEPIVGR
ncbi:MAG TPA: hypothetical protein VIS99_04975 [Terrimicrobiaceae bacterium]